MSPPSRLNFFGGPPHVSDLPTRPRKLGHDRVANPVADPFPSTANGPPKGPRRLVGNPRQSPRAGCFGGLFSRREAHATWSRDQVGGLFRGGRGRRTPRGSGFPASFHVALGGRSALSAAAFSSCLVTSAYGGARRPLFTRSCLKIEVVFRSSYRRFLLHTQGGYRRFLLQAQGGYRRFLLHAVGMRASPLRRPLRPSCCHRATL